MENFKGYIISLLLGMVISFVILKWVLHEESNDLTNKINEITIENKGLIETCDSLEQLLIDKRLEYDSLYVKLDSSRNRYDSIEIRYKYIRDSIKYLNPDESINFLRKKLDSP